MRSEAFPSQSAGQGSGAPEARSCKAASKSLRRRARVVSRFEPSLIVIGRSVFGRSVRHGTPSTVVSSCIPPESVSTHARPRPRPMTVEVAERLDRLHAAGGLSAPREAEVREPLPRPRVDREDERQRAATTSEQARHDRRRATRASSTFDGPVQRHEHVARATRGPGVRQRAPAPLEVASERVDHHVADLADALLGDALAAQVLVRVWARRRTAGRRARR